MRGGLVVLLITRPPIAGLDSPGNVFDLRDGGRKAAAVREEGSDGDIARVCLKGSPEQGEVLSLGGEQLDFGLLALPVLLSVLDAPGTGYLILALLDSRLADHHVNTDIAYFGLGSGLTDQLAEVAAVVQA